MFFEKSLVKLLVGVGALSFLSSACFPAADSLPGGCVSPAQARFRSAKNAAVLRLQRTQSKDRRFQTSPSGDTAPPGPAGVEPQGKGPDHRGKGKGRRYPAALTLSRNRS